MIKTRYLVRVAVHSVDVGPPMRAQPANQSGPKRYGWTRLAQLTQDSKSRGLGGTRTNATNNLNAPDYVRAQGVLSSKSTDCGQVIGYLAP